MASVGNVNLGTTADKIKELRKGTTCSETIGKSEIFTFCEGKDQFGSVMSDPNNKFTSVHIYDRKAMVDKSYIDNNGDGKIETQGMSKNTKSNTPKMGRSLSADAERRVAFNGITYTKYNHDKPKADKEPIKDKAQSESALHKIGKTINSSDIGLKVGKMAYSIDRNIGLAAINIAHKACSTAAGTIDKVDKFILSQHK